MVQIGLLYPKGHLLKEPLHQTYAQEASQFGGELICFPKESLNGSAEKIEGYVHEKGRWTKREARLPGVILVLEDLPIEEDHPLNGKRLIKLPLEGLLLRDKWAIYEKLQTDKFKNNLVPSLKIKSSGHFLRVLKEYRNVVIKSSKESQQQVVVEQKGDYYFVKGKGHTIETSREKLREFIIHLQKQGPHTVSPHLLCRTIEKEVFDFKVTFHKNQPINWVATEIKPRFYFKKNPSDNLKKDLNSFLIHDFPYNSVLFQMKLDRLSRQLIQHLEGLYNGFTDLELYVKMDDLQNIWVDEINWQIKDSDYVRKHLKEAFRFIEDKEVSE